jgi:uncharacterized protein (UPF0276 family)
MLITSQSTFWNSGGPRLGARWDGNAQTQNFLKAKERGLLDYMELNFPLAHSEDPWCLGLPVLSHTANNPLASAFGISIEHAGLVREYLSRTDSPWTGEHLAILGETTVGALGYVINPPLTEEFFKVACSNITTLQILYDHPIALELGPFYSVLTDGTFRNEYHFLNEVARTTNSLIILDITHTLITSRNLGRDPATCFEEIEHERVVELHVAGMRSSLHGANEYWFDAHQVPPNTATIELVGEALRLLPNVMAVTLEYSLEGEPDGFFSTLEILSAKVGKR